MKGTKIICNMCGNQISKIDLACNEFSFEHRFGYGSIHDGDLLILELCSECQDKITAHLIENCKINPLY